MSSNGGSNSKFYKLWGRHIHAKVVSLEANDTTVSCEASVSTWPSDGTGGPLSHSATKEAVSTAKHAELTS